MWILSSIHLVQPSCGDVSLCWQSSPTIGLFYTSLHYLCSTLSNRAVQTSTHTVQPSNVDFSVDQIVPQSSRWVFHFLFLGGCVISNSGKEERGIPPNNCSHILGFTPIRSCLQIVANTQCLFSLCHLTKVANPKSFSSLANP